MLVLIVWGLVIYRIIAALNPELPEIGPPSLNGLKDSPVKRDSFSFTMTRPLRDPFLGTITTTDTLKAEKVKTKIPQKNIEVTYKGIVMPTTLDDAVFVLQIKDRERLLKVGQSVDSVTLINGNANNISIKYNNMIRQIPIED